MTFPRRITEWIICPDCGARVLLPDDPWSSDVYEFNKQPWTRCNGCKKKYYLEYEEHLCGDGNWEISDKQSY